MRYISQCGMQPEYVLSRPERVMKDNMMLCEAAALAAALHAGPV